KLTKNQVSGIYNILHFQSVHQPEFNFKISLQVESLKHIGGLQYTFIIELLSIDNTNTSTIKLFKQTTALLSNNWYFLVFNHENKKANNFSIFINDTQGDLL